MFIYGNINLYSYNKKTSKDIFKVKLLINTSRHKRSDLLY